jgi:hypothetical protein
MSIQKTISGAWLVSTIHEGHYVKKLYFEYTKKEARALFSAYLKTL